MTKLAEMLRPIAAPARLRVTADDALRANKISPIAAKAAFLHEIMCDASQALALFEIDMAQLERRAMAYLSQCAADMKPPVVVTKHTRSDTGTQVAEHVRKPAVRVDDHRRRKIAMEMANKVASAIMTIDGVDIRDWTVGQCRSAARHKAHEAYVLRVLANSYSHLDHTKRIGDLIDDQTLTSIVQQGRTHAIEG